VADTKEHKDDSRCGGWEETLSMWQFMGTLFYIIAQELYDGKFEMKTRSDSTASDSGGYNSGVRYM
jgi:hypothetical protein